MILAVEQAGEERKLMGLRVGVHGEFGNKPRCLQVQRAGSSLLNMRPASPLPVILVIDTVDA